MNNVHPRIVALLPKFAKKWDISSEQAEAVAQKFSLYFTPRWGVESDAALIRLLGQVAEFEGIHSHCNS